MSNLLQNSSRPLWVWIVVIVIGSLFVLGLITVLARCWIVRRRNRCDAELMSEAPAEKQLTLRRGRLVPQHSSLSLTGSRFGLNSYNHDEVLQSPSIRSKSPFEWWANLRSRSSRLSYVSNVSSAHYGSSLVTDSMYARADLSTSKLSLASKDESLRATVTEIKMGKPQAVHHVPSSKRSSRNFEPVNFSRAFSAQTQRSLAASRNYTLSRIEEITPRQSISTSSFKARIGSYTASENGQFSEKLASKASSDSTLIGMPMAISHSRNVSSHTAREVVQQPYEQEQAFTPVSPSFPSYSSPDLSSPLIIPSFPEPALHRGSNQSLQPRQSIWESSMKQFPWLEQHQQEHDSRTVHAVSQPSTDPGLVSTLGQFILHDNIVDEYREEERGRDQTPRSSISTTYPQIPVQSQIPTTIPTGPLRTRSKKGNVLRKKSLERSRILSVHT